MAVVAEVHYGFPQLNVPNPCTCIESVRKALILGWNRQVAVLGDRQLEYLWI
jgi:hypothetical protein